MKKLSVLMNVLVISLFFVACDKDEDVTPTLKFNPTAVEVIVGGEDAVIEVSGGTTPYTIVENEEGIVEVTIEEGNEITIKGLEEGETKVTVKDKEGVEGSFAVTVVAKDEDGEENEGGE